MNCDKNWTINHYDLYDMLHANQDVVAHEDEVYFTHTDHLGSASWITNMHGEPIQYMHYAPYGELMANQQAQGYTYDERFKFTGKERDEESGYDFFGARHYCSSHGFWIKVDPLADKYPHVTPYIFCGGNPIMLVDSDGKQWTDIDGNPIPDQSRIKVYLFYNPEEFSEQTMKMAEDYEKLYGRGTVALSNVTTEEEFAADWKTMCSQQSGVIVNINHHGSNQAIHLDASSGQYLTSTGDGTTNKNHSKNHVEISDLGQPNLHLSSATLLINSCHSAFGMNYNGYKMRGSNETVMKAFINYSGFQYIRGTILGVSYSRLTKHPRPHLPSNDFWLYYTR